MGDVQMLSCQDAARRLDDYVDRELTPEELRAVEAHLAVCANCAPVFRFQEGFLRHLQATIGRIQAPEGLLEQVMTRLRTVTGDSPPPRAGTAEGDRTRISSGTPWEPVFGYSRAIRVGNSVHVSGTTATGPDGQLVGEGDMYAQTVQTLANIRRALEHAGARFEDVVRTRVYITDISRYDEVARAHREVFGEIRPASALIGVAALVDPAMLVEIEVDAVIPDAG